MKYKIGDLVTLATEYNYNDAAGDQKTIASGTQGQVKQVYPTYQAYLIAFSGHGDVRVHETQLN